MPHRQLGGSGAGHLRGRRTPAGDQRHEDARSRRHLAPGGVSRAPSGDCGDHAHRLRRHRGGGGLSAPRCSLLPPQATQAHRPHPGYRAGAGQAADRAGAQALPEEAGAQGARSNQRAAYRAEGRSAHLPEHPSRPGGGARCPGARDLRPQPAGGGIHHRHRRAAGAPRPGAGGDRPRRAPPRHREDRRARRGAAQAGSPHYPGMVGDEAPPGHRLPDDPGHPLPQHPGGDRPQPPGALRRQGLPPGTPRRGDPHRGPDLRPGRHPGRDDLRPPLSPGDQLRERGRRDQALLQHPVRPGIGPGVHGHRRRRTAEDQGRHGGPQSRRPRSSPPRPTPPRSPSIRRWTAAGSSCRARRPRAGTPRPSPAAPAPPPPPAPPG